MNHYRRALQLIVLLLLLGSVVPLVAAAQTTAYAVQVTLRDAAGQPVPFVTATAHDLAGQALVTAQTDATGSATLGDLHVSTVRIVVAGQLRDGTPLVLPGADAAGILVLLDGPQTPLDMVVDADGRVGPDPATMFALQPSGIDAPVPLDIRDAPLAPPAPGMLAPAATIQPTVVPSATAQDGDMLPAAAAAAAVSADAVVSADSDTAWTTYRFMLVLAGILLLIGSGLVFVRARRPRRQP